MLTPDDAKITTTLVSTDKDRFIFLAANTGLKPGAVAGGRLHIFLHKDGKEYLKSVELTAATNEQRPYWIEPDQTYQLEFKPEQLAESGPTLDDDNVVGEYLGSPDPSSKLNAKSADPSKPTTIRCEILMEIYGIKDVSESPSPIQCDRLRLYAFQSTLDSNMEKLKRQIEQVKAAKH